MAYATVSIADLDTYLSGMRKSMKDKVWFLDRLDPAITNIYDFGCADGTLLREVGMVKPSLNLLGYDKSPAMTEVCAREIDIHNRPLCQVPQHTLLNASSVFHEIHSYGSRESIRSDYNAIFHVGADYIAIRDMFYTKYMNRHSNPTQMVLVERAIGYQKVREFEHIHGSISDNKNLLHLLLKYRYTENWAREVRENYFPHSFEDFIKKIPNNYEVVYSNLYTLPFLRQKIWDDIGFWLQYPTHAKILLRRKGIKRNLCLN